MISPGGGRGGSRGGKGGDGQALDEPRDCHAHLIEHSDLLIFTPAASEGETWIAPAPSSSPRLSAAASTLILVTMNRYIQCVLLNGTESLLINTYT